MSTVPTVVGVEEVLEPSPSFPGRALTTLGSVKHVVSKIVSKAALKHVYLHPIGENLVIWYS